MCSLCNLCNTYITSLELITSHTRTVTQQNCRRVTGVTCIWVEHGTAAKPALGACFLGRLRHATLPQDAAIAANTRTSTSSATRSDSGEIARILGCLCTPCVHSGG